METETASFTPADATPLLTHDLPGTDGHLGTTEDFVVEEIPAYEPTGEGDHLYAWIEKRELTTPQAIGRLASHLGIPPRDVGSAGLKDRNAITRQWLSFPGRDIEKLESYRDPDEKLRVLRASRHGNKLRTGHLRGNRFTVVLRDTHEDARRRALAILAHIEKEGLPNYFGVQRFGREGDNADRALLALKGKAKLPRDRRLKRLLISALQAQLFNELLALRVVEGKAPRLIDGDVLQRRDSGGVFISDDVTTDAERMARGEIVITGPICGPRMPRPREGSPARTQEDALLARFDTDPDAFSRFGRLARGGRRPLLVFPEDLTLREISNDGEAPALRLSFALPAGSYATVLLREVTH